MSGTSLYAVTMFLKSDGRCTCERWRHPSDPDGGLCAWCEDAALRGLIEAHAEGEPPTEDEMEDADAP